MGMPSCWDRILSGVELFQLILQFHCSNFQNRWLACLESAAPGFHMSGLTSRDRRGDRRTSLEGGRRPSGRLTSTHRRNKCQESEGPWIWEKPFGEGLKGMFRTNRMSRRGTHAVAASVQIRCQASAGGVETPPPSHEGGPGPGV